MSNKMSKIKELIYKPYGLIRSLIKTINLNLYYSRQREDVIEVNLKEKLNTIYINLISLVNEGSYSRFNSFDYLTKSSKIVLIINSLERLEKYYYLKPNERSKTRAIINNISSNYPSLERISYFILQVLSKGQLNDKALFILIRNFIASEWIYRNIKGPKTKIKLKDLNYLNYTIEEYQEYLHNCLNMLIRDTKRFISRYPEEYKLNPDIDLELLMSLRHTVYNDFKFSVPDHIINNDINGIDLFDIIEKDTEIITIKGWFRDKPKSDYINAVKYKAYRKSIKDNKIKQTYGIINNA